MCGKIYKFKQMLKLYLINLNLYSVYEFKEN